MNSKFNASDPKKSPQKSETRFETKRELIGLCVGSSRTRVKWFSETKATDQARYVRLARA